MIEKAIIDQRVQNLIIDTLKVSKKNKNIASFGYKQIDAILKKIRDKMKVNNISNLESEKMSFESDDVHTLGFGKWLSLNILLQSTWNQVKHEGEDKHYLKGFSERQIIDIKNGTDDDVLAYATQEIYWKISSFADEFTDHIVNQKVLSYLTEYQEKSGNKATINKYIE